ncbi:MAG TPA: metal-dependent transcriptional regulator [Nitrolancea sp.]
MTDESDTTRQTGRKDDVITHAMEDYLKAIYNLQSEHEKVTTQAIAERLNIQSPSVTNMVKRLADLKLLEHTPYRGVALTAGGMRSALEVIRHHRLLELYLAESLGYSWDEVHEEAERLEHSMSEELEARIDRALGYPTTDPHGDPIPSFEGDIQPQTQLLLAELDTGEDATVERVNDRDPGMLRYLGSLGLYPNAAVQVLERFPFGGPLRVRVLEQEHIIGRELAEAVFVRRLSD